MQRMDVRKIYMFITRHGYIGVLLGRFLEARFIMRRDDEATKAQNGKTSTVERDQRSFLEREEFLEATSIVKDRSSRGN